MARLMSQTALPIAERIVLRTAKLPDDEALLEHLYLRTRDDLTGVFADAAQTRQLIEIQYRAQMAAYSGQFPDAAYEIILLEDKPVGRVIVDRRPDDVTLVDIALLPEARGLGIGTVVIQRLIDECSNPVFLEVVKTNRARDLYERLGFRVIDDSDSMRILMRRD